MNLRCKYCTAYHFLGKFDKKNKQFKNCCHKGIVKVPSDPEYPTELMELYNNNSKLGKNFKNNIRGYNNSSAFASFRAKFKNVAGKGPQIIKIGGQIYHNTYALHPNENDVSKFGQLYVIERNIANKIRNDQNSEFSKELLTKLDIL